MAKKSDKPKRKLQPITSTLVVNWTKPESDPIRHAEFCRVLRELIDKYMPIAEKAQKEAAEKIESKAKL